LDVGHMPEEPEPASRPSPPRPAIRPSPPPRRPAHRPFVVPSAADAEPPGGKRSGVLAVLVVLVLAAAAAYWYFVYRPAHPGAPAATARSTQGSTAWSGTSSARGAGGCERGVRRPSGFGDGLGLGCSDQRAAAQDGSHPAAHRRRALARRDR